MYYTQEQIDRANQADLVSFLQSQGEQLTRAGNEYRWKRHDSLTVRGNKWYRHSQSKGGGPVDFIMEFFGKSFTEAVELLTGEKGAAPPPDRPCPASLSDFRLPPPNSDNRTARNYLTAARRIDEDVTGFFFARGDIYEDAAHHNAVFVGRDEDGIPRYAHSKGTAGNFRLDVKGSDKAFNFCYRGEGDRLFVFEAPVDLLSFLCLFKKAWQKQSYLSLGGVGEKALLRFLSDRPNIHNLKQAAKTLTIYQQYGFSSPEQLEAAVATAYQEMRQTSGELKALETKLQGKRELRQQVLAYAKTKPIREGLKAQKSEKARAAYRQANESDFIIAEAAARYFKAQGLTKLPGRKALQAEIEQLISEKDGLYNTYHEQKQRFRELQTVKRNIDQILRREEPHRRKEQSHER